MSAARNISSDLQDEPKYEASVQKLMIVRITSGAHVKGDEAFFPLEEEPKQGLRRGHGAQRRRGDGSL